MLMPSASFVEKCWLSISATILYHLPAVKHQSLDSIRTAWARYTRHGVPAGRRSCVMTVADRVIRWSTALAVLSVAAIAAMVSYEHASALARAHGEPGWTGRPISLTVDGLIYASSSRANGLRCRAQRGGYLSARYCRSWTAVLSPWVLSMSTMSRPARTMTGWPSSRISV